MVAHMQTLRSSNAGTRPVAGTRQPGELYVNYPDMMFGVIDTSGNPLDLQAVRKFSTGAAYNLGDYVTNAGTLYRAVTNMAAGGFVTANWSPVMTAASTAAGYLPLTGGTLTGQLVVRSSVVCQGAGGMFEVFDRGNGGGSTSQATGLYRDGNQGALWMSEYGNVLTWNTAGNVSVTNTLSVSSTMSCYGVLSVNAAAIHNPLQITTGPGYVGAIYWNPQGQDTWLCGPLATVAANTFYIYDNSNQGQKISVSAYTVSIFGNTFAAVGSGQLCCGASGHWDDGNTLTLSPQTSGSGSAGSCMAYAYKSSQACYMARTDIWTAYLMYYFYGAGNGVGSITANGSNTFYNTTCDARRKENVRPLSSEIDVGADVIDRLKPVAFEWLPFNGKSLPEKDPDGAITKDGEDISWPSTTGHGFVAQDLYEVLPDIVHRPPDDAPKGMDGWSADYSKIVPYLVAELQNLRARLAKVEARP